MIVENKAGAKISLDEHSAQGVPNDIAEEKFAELAWYAKRLIQVMPMLGHDTSSTYIDPELAEFFLRNDSKFEELTEEEFEYAKKYTVFSIAADNFEHIRSISLTTDFPVDEVSISFTKDYERDAEYMQRLCNYIKSTLAEVRAERTPETFATFTVKCENRDEAEQVINKMRNEGIKWKAYGTSPKIEDISPKALQKPVTLIVTEGYLVRSNIDWIDLDFMKSKYPNMKEISVCDYLGEKAECLETEQQEER